MRVNILMEREVARRASLAPMAFVPFPLWPINLE